MPAGEYRTSAIRVPSNGATCAANPDPTASARTATAHPMLHSIAPTTRASAAPLFGLYREAGKCRGTRHSPPRASVGELGAEEEDLRRVVDPDQQRDK